MLPNIRPLVEAGVVRTPQAVALVLLTPDMSGLTISEISDLTGSQKSSVTMSINHMEETGAAERRYPLRDGRTVRVYLTEKGRAVSQRMHDALASYVKTLP